MNSPWFSYQEPLKASFRLFCLPFAGGGTSTYSKWNQWLSSEVDAIALRLPGREKRWGETPVRSMSALIDILMEEIEPFLDRPYAIYGHSMGGRIGYELIRALRQNHLPLPETFFAAACRAPHVPRASQTLHVLSDEEFVKMLTRLYDGIPKTIRDDPAMLKLFLPLIRADIELFESANFQRDYPLECPIVALYGKADLASTKEFVALWAEHTSREFEMHEFDAGHFFLNEWGEQICTLIKEKVKSLRTLRN